MSWTQRTCTRPRIATPSLVLALRQCLPAGWRCCAVAARLRRSRVRTALASCSAAAWCRGRGTRGAVLRAGHAQPPSPTLSKREKCVEVCSDMSSAVSSEEFNCRWAHPQVQCCVD
eukprot:1452327-Pleurochrysis_carterae.AAC.2